MRSVLRASAALASAVAVQADSPVGKVVSMISELQATIIKEGKGAQTEYEEFAEWCEDRARNLGFEIKTGRSESESLKASIAQETATIETLQAKVEKLSASIASDDADLTAATKIRETENKDFSAEAADLVETIDMLQRATGILEREMKGGSSMLQDTASSLADAFTVMVQASLISSSDANRLTALVQDEQKAKESSDDEELGAPAATVYASHSGNIVDTLQGLTEKAEAQLAAARNKETSNVNHFEMLKQALEDSMRVETAEVKEAQKAIGASKGRKSVATGDLRVTSSDLASDEKAKATLHHNCMTKASTFEAETKSRDEELKALAEAKKVIVEATSGAALAQASFVQISRSKLSSRADLADLGVVHLIRDLARKQGSTALAQLASRMSASMHSKDAFAKIKGLISDMVARLEQEASADATKKSYCDKELSETNVKKGEKSNEIAKLTTRIDRMVARSAQLKEEVAALQNQLSKLARSQSDMDRLRQEEKTAFSANKADLEKGLTGLKLALKILNEYYGSGDKAHEAAEGAGSSIIGLLEVCEADFTKSLAQVTSDEDLAVSQYEQASKDNEIETAAKEQDVMYKNKESNDMDKTSGELSTDRSSVQAELDAVMEYLSRIESECTEQAETYASRKERYEAEIAGLKEALQILESDTAFVQKHAKRATLRGRMHLSNQW